jgi:conjugal transfer ATP-binding protein TraC
MSAIHQAMQQAAARSLPDEFIPVNAYDEETGVFLCDDGYIGVCYTGNPVNGADDTTAEMLKGAFSLSLPAGSFIQISLLGMPDIDSMLVNYRYRRENGIDRIQSPQARKALETFYQRRLEFLSKARFESNSPTTGVKIHDRTIVVSLKIPYAGLEPKPEDVETVAESGAKLSESLQAIGLFTRRVNREEYLRIAFRLTHPYDEQKIDPVREDQLLKHQVFVPGESIEVRKDALEFSDGTLAQMLSVGRWPKKNAMSLMAYMIGDPLGANNQIKLPYHINLTLHYPAQYQKTSAMKQKAGLINYQAFGPLPKFVPKLFFKKQGMDVLVNAMEQGATVVEGTLTLTVYGKERDEVSRQMATLRTYLQSFDFAMGEEKYILWPQFWNSFPLFPTVESIKNTFRFKTLAVEQAMTFAPLLGEWKGTSSAMPMPDKGHGMLLQSRRGQLMALDLYDTSTNMNGVVFAAAGSGKSFFTQMLVTEYLSMGAKVWAIDVGRSYYKLAKIMGGMFIEFGNDSGLCLNPFTNVENIDEEVGLIQAIIEKMAAPEDGLDDYRRSRLEEAIKAVWGNKGTSSTITDVANYLLGQDDQRVSDIGNMLYRFTEHGSEGYWFNGKANLDMDRDLVVLELEELKGKITLQQVVLMQIIAAIQHEMYLSEDGRPKVLIIDEAWDLLDDPMVSRFMEHAYRRFRKYMGSAIIVTQSISDLYKNDAGKAIAANSAFKFILRQEAEVVDQVQEAGYLSLGDYGFYQLRSVHSVPGKYSEVMIYTNGQLGISRLIVDRFTGVLFSTSGKERNEVIDAMEAGVEPVQAIDDYIAKYG